MRIHSNFRTAVTAILAVSVLALAGCGDSTGTPTSTSSSSSDQPRSAAPKAVAKSASKRDRPAAKARTSKQQGSSTDRGGGDRPAQHTAGQGHAKPKSLQEELDDLIAGPRGGGSGQVVTPKQAEKIIRELQKGDKENGTSGGGPEAVEGAVEQLLEDLGSAR